MSAASTPITPEAAAAFNAANAAFREGRFEAARDAAARAAQLAPDLAIAHVLKARALRRIGDEPAARAAYDAALAADPASFDALLERGNVLRGLGEAAEAAASYSRAMAARPLDVRPALALARLWEEQPGQDAAEQAAIAFQRALDLAAVIDLDLADVYLRLGMTSEAQTLMERLSASEDPALLRTLAQLAYRFN